MSHSNKKQFKKQDFLHSILSQKKTGKKFTFNEKDINMVNSLDDLFAPMQLKFDERRIVVLSKGSSEEEKVM